MGQAPFSTADHATLRGMGIAPEAAESQWQALQEGRRFTWLVRPATRGDGIRVLSAAEVERHVARYQAALPGLPAAKFVPASGAASRMFQCLDPLRLGAAPDPEADRVLTALANRELALADDLERAMAAGGDDLDQRLAAGDHAVVANWLLGEGGLDLARRPKALIPFHRIAAGVRSALDEHLVDAARLTGGRVHFTVAPEWREVFQRHLARSGNLGAATSLSIQSPATQTFALDANGDLLRDDRGQLVLRPGGHGALLANLAARSERLLFIQNVDNVLPDGLDREASLYWRRVMAGLLLETQEKVAFGLQMLADAAGEERDLVSFETWARETLGYSCPAGNCPAAERRARMVSFLQRPLRVAGMVAAQGEPGGGPYWVAGDGGQETLQIVEGVEIDFSDPRQREIAAAVTHFNPVDLVVSWTNPAGEPYDLSAFRDPGAFLIAEKRQSGKPVRILEHPGLWNGGMAGWNTILIELPAEVFQPVKSVVDLLREGHRGPYGEGVR